MQLFETTGEPARGLIWLTEHWHPLILRPLPWVLEITYLPGEADPWSCRIKVRRSKRRSRFSTVYGRP
jgi:hypothetical protein